MNMYTASILLFCYCICKTLSKPVNISSLAINDKDLLPKDHIPGVKLERDGHINPVFHHEAFLGRLVDEDKLDIGKLDGAKKLIKIFHKVDKNNNHKVDVQELTEWIYARIADHLEHASQMNKEKFTEVDTNKDGLLSLEEYLRGLTAGDMALKNAIDSQKTVEQIESIMEDALPEELAKWKKSDLDSNNQLNPHEFLAFHHPEHNENTIQMMADDLISNMDDDGDSKLSINEFVRVPPGEVIEEDQKAEDEKYFAERRNEFSNMIDLDKDGLVTKDELIAYFNPKNKQHAVKEANYLMSVADKDGDGELSEQEMIVNYELFTGSTMSGNPNLLHDEF